MKSKYYCNWKKFVKSKYISNKKIREITWTWSWPAGLWMHILSDMAVAAPKAQHEPQPPWSQIMEMDLQVGHFLRGSNSVKKKILNYFFKVARSSYNLWIILSYPLAGLFEYLFMFWWHRNLQALNSEQSAKGGIKD